MFTVLFVADDELLEGATVSQNLGLETLRAEAKSAFSRASGLVKDGGTMKNPGFLRCIVTTEVEGKRILALEANHPIIPEQSEAVNLWIEIFIDAAK